MAASLLARPVQEFALAARDVLTAAFESEAARLAQASEWIAGAIAAGGVLRVFGTGHSRLVAEEVFYRAGGLAPLEAVLDDDVSGYRDVTKSELVERLEGLGALIVAHSRMSPPDILLVISQSGRNAVPIEVTEAARARGMKTIALTSFRHARGQPSRHSSGLHLHEVADLAIDNCVPEGDCSVRLEGGLAMGPLSGVVGAALAQALVIGAAESLRRRGIEPPVFRSGNVDGGREANDQLIARFWPQVRGW
jgi:uncharacterized phosphosugar-binding protein